MSNRPNFFLLGAPKCGTTSLAKWLGDHKSIFISKPKELKYFNTDVHLPNRPHSIDGYEAFFKDASHYPIRGEATTGYLASKIAISRILKYSSSAKFLVCLRNPVDMVSSLHAQRLKEGVETERDLIVAWQKEGLRRQNKSVPFTCPDPQILFYSYICSLGDQVEALLTMVPRSFICFVFLEDLKENPRREYQRVLSFLDVEDDQRTLFPVRNVGKVPQKLWIAQSSRFLGRYKRKLGCQINFGIQRWIHLNNEFPKSDEIDLAFRKELIQFYSEDVCKLGKLVDRDLSHWLLPEQS